MIHESFTSHPGSKGGDISPLAAMAAPLAAPLVAPLVLVTPTREPPMPSALQRHRAMPLPHERTDSTWESASVPWFFNTLPGIIMVTWKTTYLYRSMVFRNRGQAIRFHDSRPLKDTELDLVDVDIRRLDLRFLRLVTSRPERQEFSFFFQNHTQDPPRGVYL